MSSSSNLDSLPLEIHSQILEMAEGFEDGCEKREFSPIEDFLRQLDPEYQGALLKLLLGLELDYRAKFALPIDRAPFLERFPEHSEVVREVFRETRLPPEKRSIAPASSPDGFPQFGPYVATEELGRGGFGVVYLAEHEAAGHSVAIKVGEQLMVEAKTLVSLKHPSIARVLYVGQDSQERPYLVMDYMEGGSLRDRIADGQSLSPTEATRIALQIAEALDVAHTHPDQIVHRDLKPENILFEEVSEEARAYVADFGLALTESEQHGHRGDYSGTLPYQSPEQVRGEADWIDARSDIWSLGVILYEMLTGRRPFRGDDLRDQIQNKSHKSPRLIDNGIPESLEAICMKCLEKEARNRYQTADALANALRGQELGINPYKGLEAFDEADAANFFGREDQIERIKKEFDRLYKASLNDSSHYRILSILGPSGSGKSSLARAGLVPTLRRCQFPNRSETRVAVFRPRTRPLKSLADVLDRFTIDAEDAGVQQSLKFVRAMQETHPSGEAEGLWWIVDSLPNISNAPIVLVIDQFEELFTECEDDAERRLFIDNILYAVSRKDGALSVVFTLRSDFLPETQEHERLNQLVSNQGLLVPAMSESELRDAITKPAKLSGYEFDNAIVELMVKDTHRREGALPLLQIVLAKVWDELRHGNEPADTYREMGEIGGALANAAESVYRDLNPNEQRIARRVFLGLVKPGEGTQDTRRPSDVESLLAHDDDPEIAMEVLRCFSSKQNRLISLRKKYQSSGQKAIEAELTHEALLEHWQRLRDWLDGSRSDLRFRELIHASAERWDKLGRSEGSLWRPPDLDILKKRLPDISDDLSELQKSFVDASIRQEEARIVDERERQEGEKKRQKTQLRRLTAGLALFACMAFGLAGLVVLALQQRENALALVERTDIAEESASRTKFFTQTVLAKRELDEGRGRGFRALMSEIKKDAGRFKPLEYDWLYGQQDESIATVSAHDGGLNAVTWSPSSRNVASGDEHGVIRIWSTESWDEVLAMRGHTGEIRQLAWNPNGRLLASCSVDGSIRLWNTSSGECLQTIASDELMTATSPEQDDETDVLAIAWSKSGKRLIAALGDGSLECRLLVDDSLQHHHATRCCRLGENQKLNASQIDCHPTKELFIVGFSCDTLVTDFFVVDHDGKVLRELNANQPRGVDGVAWSSEGLKIAFGAGEGHVRLYDDVSFLVDKKLRKAPLARTIGKHLGMGHATGKVAWSPHPKVFATVRADEVIRVWDVGDAAQSEVLFGHTSRINDFAWSPNGEWIVSCDEAGRLKFWSGTSFSNRTCRLTLTNWITDAHWHPDSRSIAICDLKSRIHIWNLESREHLEVLGHPLGVQPRLWSVRWDPTGRFLAAGGAEGEIRLVNIDSPEECKVLNGKYLASTSLPDSQIVMRIRWDSTGRFIAAASQDADIHNDVRLTIWDITTGDIVHATEGLASACCSWAPDSMVLAYPAKGNLIKRLRLSCDSDEVAVSDDGEFDAAHSNRVTAIGWSGQSIATGDTRGGVTAYQFDTGEVEFGPVRHHDDEIRSICFSPDGARIVTGSDAHEIVVCTSATGELSIRESGYQGSVWACDWSADGRFLATGGFDNLLRISYWGKNADEVTQTFYQLNAIQESAQEFRQAELASIRRLVASSPPDVAAFYRDRTEDVAAAIQEHSVTSPEGKNETRSVEFWRLEQIIRDDPGNIAALSRRSKLHTARRNYELAIDDLDTIISFHETHLETLYSRALLHRELGDHNATIADLARVLRADDHFPDAHHYRAHAFAALGENESAIDDIQIAISLDESSQHLLDVERNLLLDLEDNVFAFRCVQKTLPKGDDFSAKMMRYRLMTILMLAKRERNVNIEEAATMLRAIEPRQATLANLEDAVADDWYNLACIRSLLLECDRKVGRDTDLSTENHKSAIDALRESMESGFKDYALAASDRDLDPIRSTKEFKALVQGQWQYLATELLRQPERLDRISVAPPAEGSSPAVISFDDRTGIVNAEQLVEIAHEIAIAETDKNRLAHVLSVLERLRREDLVSPDLKGIEAIVSFSLHGSHPSASSDDMRKNVKISYLLAQALSFRNKRDNANAVKCIEECFELSPGISSHPLARKLRHPINSKATDNE